VVIASSAFLAYEPTTDFIRLFSGLLM